jgi:hypothetical protein
VGHVGVKPASDRHAPSRPSGGGGASPRWPKSDSM